MSDMNKQAWEAVKWMSRDARRFMGAEPPFDARIGYESDVDAFVTTPPSWVTGEEDLTELGRSVRAILLAHPELVEG